MSSNIFPAFRDEPPPMDDFDLDDEDDDEFGSFASFNQTTTVTQSDLSSVNQSVSTTKTINGGSHIESTPDSLTCFPTHFEAPSVKTTTTSDSHCEVSSLQSDSTSNKIIDVTDQSRSTLKRLIDSAVGANKKDNDDDNEDWGDFDGGAPKSNTITSGILEGIEVKSKPDDDTTDSVKDESAGVLNCIKEAQRDSDNADDWGDFDSHSATIEPESKCVSEPEMSISKSCVEAEAVEQEIASDSFSEECHEGQSLGQLPNPCAALDLSVPNSFESEADGLADSDAPPIKQLVLNNALAGESIASSDDKSDATGVGKLHMEDSGLDHSEHCPDENEFSDSCKVNFSEDAIGENKVLSDSSAESEVEVASESNQAAIGERLTEDLLGATPSESISVPNCHSKVQQVDDGKDDEFNDFSACSADGNGIATEEQLSEESVPSVRALDNSASCTSHQHGSHEGGGDGDDDWGAFDAHSTDKDKESFTLQATEQSKGATDEAQKDVSPVSSVPETQDTDHDTDSSGKAKAKAVEEEPLKQVDEVSSPPNSTSDVFKADEADSADSNTFGGSSANKDEEVVPELDTEEGTTAPADIKEDLSDPDDKTRAEEVDDDWSAFDSHSHEATEQTPQDSSEKDLEWGGFGGGGGATETGDSWSAFGNSSQTANSKADDADKGDEEEDWAAFGNAPSPANQGNEGSDDDFGDFSTDVAPATKSEQSDVIVPRKSDLANQPTPLTAKVDDDDDDDFDDFASPAPVPQSKTEASIQDDGDDDDFDDFVVPAPPPASITAKKGGDEFGDFSSETTTKAATPSVPASARLSQRKELFSRAMNQSFGAADDEARTEDGDVPQLLQWVWTIDQPAAEEGKQHGGLRCVWEKLLEAESAKAPLVLRWGSSQCSKSVLAGLRIDSRNVLTAGKKANVPVFAAQIGLLQPMKPGEVASKPEASASDNSATPNVLVDTKPDNSAAAPQSSVETVPEAEFDWTGSGLENPLQGGEGGASLDLDFFSTAPATGAAGTHTHSTSACSLESLEAEFLSSPSASPVKKKTEESKPGMLDSLLSRLTGTTTTTTAARDDKLSEEARSFISRLPDLSFMSASVLMFPVKQEGLGDSGKDDET